MRRGRRLPPGGRRGDGHLPPPSEHLPCCKEPVHTASFRADSTEASCVLPWTARCVPSSLCCGSGESWLCRHHRSSRSPKHHFDVQDAPRVLVGILRACAASLGGT